MISSSVFIKEWIWKRDCDFDFQKGLLLRYMIHCFLNSKDISNLWFYIEIKRSTFFSYQRQCTLVEISRVGVHMMNGSLFSKKNAIKKRNLKVHFKKIIYDGISIGKFTRCTDAVLYCCIHFLSLLNSNSPYPVLTLSWGPCFLFYYLQVQII